MKVLLSGFEPFGNLTTNASWEAVRLVKEDLQEEITVKTVLLPVEYAHAAEILLQAGKDCHADVILAVGVAEGRHSITPEYMAININDAKLPDNAGVVKCYTPIIEEGDAVFYSNLPLKDMAEAAVSCGFPVELSFDAGRYVCNDLFYRLMYEIKYSENTIYGGFLHLPPEERLPPDRAARAIEVMLLRLFEKHFANTR